MVCVELILDSGARPGSSLFLELGGHWPGAVPAPDSAPQGAGAPASSLTVWACSAWGPRSPSASRRWPLRLCLRDLAGQLGDGRSLSRLIWENRQV